MRLMCLCLSVHELKVSLPVMQHVFWVNRNLAAEDCSCGRAVNQWYKSRSPRMWNHICLRGTRWSPGIADMVCCRLYDVICVHYIHCSGGLTKVCICRSIVHLCINVLISVAGSNQLAAEKWVILSEKEGKIKSKWKHLWYRWSSLALVM